MPLYLILGHQSLFKEGHNYAPVSDIGLLKFDVQLFIFGFFQFNPYPKTPHPKLPTRHLDTEVCPAFPIFCSFIKYIATLLLGAIVLIGMKYEL